MKHHEPIPESLHWYDRQGNPVFDVPLKKPAKDGRTVTTPTLRHAREMNLFPSVTSIRKVLATPKQVIDWMVNIAIDCGMSNRTRDGAMAQFMMERDKPADAGTLLHEEVCNLLDTDYQGPTEDYQEISLDAAHSIALWMKEHDLVLTSIEEPFAHPSGFAGRVDCQMETPDGNKVIVDLKTMNNNSYTNLRKPYDSWTFQLAGYRKGLTSHADCCIIVLNRETGMIKPFTFTKQEIDRAEEQFDLAFRLWQMERNYNPSTGGTYYV